MVSHVTYGKCELKVEREFLLDTAMVWYIEKKLWGDESSLSVETSDVRSAVSLSGLHKKEEEGWALKSTKKTKAFSEKAEDVSGREVSGGGNDRKKTRSRDSGKVDENSSGC